MSIRRPPVTKIANKGAQQALLPSRKALNMLGANPTLSSVGNYSKLTPSGSAGGFAPDVLERAQRTPPVKPAIRDE